MAAWPAEASGIQRATPPSQDLKEEVQMLSRSVVVLEWDVGRSKLAEVDVGPGQ